ncbi:MAG: DNA methyltransferase [Dolichospermum sp.]
MGSGTTAMVALDLNRLVIGFEVRQDYCDIAANRIETFLEDKNSRIEQLSLLW